MEGGSSSGSQGLHVAPEGGGGKEEVEGGWAEEPACGGAVWALSMAKEERMRTAWRHARNAALRDATAWWEVRERRASAEEEA